MLILSLAILRKSANACMPSCKVPEAEAKQIRTDTVQINIRNMFRGILLWMTSLDLLAI